MTVRTLCWTSEVRLNHSAAGPGLCSSNAFLISLCGFTFSQTLSSHFSELSSRADLEGSGENAVLLSKTQSAEWEQAAGAATPQTTCQRGSRGTADGGKCWWGCTHHAFVDSVFTFDIALLKVNTIIWQSFVCVCSWKWSLHTAGHVLILVQSISINTVNHTQTGLMNMKGTWPTSQTRLEALAKPLQRSPMNRLKILSGQRICTH